MLKERLKVGWVRRISLEDKQIIAVGQHYFRRRFDG